MHQLSLICNCRTYISGLWWVPCSIFPPTWCHDLWIEASRSKWPSNHKSPLPGWYKEEMTSHTHRGCVGLPTTQTETHTCAPVMNFFVLVMYVPWQRTYQIWSSRCGVLLSARERLGRHPATVSHQWGGSQNRQKQRSQHTAPSPKVFVFSNMTSAAVQSQNMSSAHQTVNYDIVSCINIPLLCLKVWNILILHRSNYIWLWKTPKTLLLPYLLSCQKCQITHLAFPFTCVWFNLELKRLFD